MERLTKQMADKYYYKSMPYQDNFYINKVVTKLGTLEDLFDLYGIETFAELELIISHNIEDKMFKINEDDLDDYLINKRGDIFSVKNRVLLKQYKNKQGYAYVIIHKKQRLIHRLVAKTFIDNPNNYREVNHKNEIKDDNRVENLEWCNRKYNATYNNCHLRHSDWNKKGINQYDLQGNFIKHWNYAKDIEIAGITSASSAKQCCRNQLCESKGFVWRFDNDAFETRRIKKEYDRTKNFRKNK